MVKSKVGAEPKVERIKHRFGKNEGFHEGVHRDEYGWFESKYHSYCFANGYFFHRGKTLAVKLNADYIRDNWDNGGYYDGIKDCCFGIINRKRKLAIINYENEYGWKLYNALPSDYTVVLTKQSFPYYDILESKHRKDLVKIDIAYNIEKYAQTFYCAYKVLTTRSKIIDRYSYNVNERNRFKERILEIYNKNKWLPKTKVIGNEFTYYGYMDFIKITIPTIKQILEDTMFTDEQKLHIEQCKFYTKYCYNRGTSWKFVVDNWGTDEITKIKEQIETENANWEKTKKHYEELNHKNKAEAIAALNGDDNINKWRNGESLNFIKYKSYICDDRTRLVINSMSSIYDTFTNTQLRIKPGKPNWVETSRNALVPLETAINLFNRLYVDYIISDKTKFTFSPTNENKVGSFYISLLEYTDKYADVYYGCNRNQHRELGYKEWKFQIGCHTLWFDDVKAFAKYYNLQDKLSFPLDKSTKECMKNHLIHLPSGTTISAVGTSGVLDK